MAPTGDLTESQMRHLELIEAVINRMSQNSFTLRGWAVTLVTATIAFGASQGQPASLLIGLIPTLGFWYLDAYWLRRERLFRRLYDGVRRSQVTEPFSLDIQPYRQDVPRTLALAVRAPALVPLYVGLLVALLGAGVASR